MEIRPVYLLIVSMVVLVISITLVAIGVQPARDAIPPGPVAVRLLGSPQIEPIGVQGCTKANDVWSCEYPIRARNLLVSSSNLPDDVAVVASYKGQDWLVPCGSGALKKGPCRISGETSLDIETDLSGPVYGTGGALNPPSLNLSGNSFFLAKLANDQKVILKNFEITSTVFVLSAVVTFTEKVLLTLGCKDEKQVISLKEGESASIGMCGGNVDVKVKDIDSGDRKACVELATQGGTQWEGSGDTLKVSFWKYNDDFRGINDLLPCGDLFTNDVTAKYEYFDKIRFDSTVALKEPKCLNSFLGSFDFPVSIPPYDPATNAYKPDDC